MRFIRQPLHAVCYWAWNSSEWLDLEWTKRTTKAKLSLEMYDISIAIGLACIFSDNIIELKSTLTAYFRHFDASNQRKRDEFITEKPDSLLQLSSIFEKKCRIWRFIFPKFSLKSAFMQNFIIWQWPSSDIVTSFHVSFLFHWFFFLHN